MRNKFILTVLSVVLLLSPSCEKRGGKASPATGDITFLFCHDDPYTKSATQVKEGEISDINIFLYDEQGKLAYWRYTDKTDTDITMSITIDRSYSIYAVANVGDLTGSDVVKSAGGLTTLHSSFATAASIVNSVGAIPMAAYIPQEEFSDGSTKTLSLTRLLSKFRIILDKSGLDASVSKFDIKQVRLRNLNKKVYYFKDSKATAAEDILDTGETLEGDDLANIFTTGVDFYIPENMQGDLLSDNIDQKTHIPPDDKKGLCTYVEFTVDYKSSTQYDESLIYRYYLHDGRFLDNFDLVRNTMYTCKTTFSGSGINETTWRIDASSMNKYVTGIEVSPSSHTFTAIGETHTFTATVLPSDAADNSVTWSSSNTSVATVNPTTGTVTSVADGTCTITATANDGSGVSGSASVIVDTYVYPTSVSVTPATGEIFVGETLQLTATVLPDNANNKSVTWSSDNNSVATVSATGLVTGVAAGSVTITATTVDAGKTGSATITVKDKSFSMDDIPILYPNYNSPYTLTWSGAPPGTPVFTLEKLSGEDCLSVSESVLTATYSGSASSGVVGTYKVKGAMNGINKEKETSVSLGSVTITAPPSILNGVEQTAKVTSKTPADAEITWSSSDSDVATIGTDGKITPISAGTTTIKAASITGAYATAEVTVVNPTITLSALTLYEGETKAISCSVTPEGAKEHLTWSVSEGSEYISVDQQGNVTALKRTKGATAKVRATYKHTNTIYSEATVTVNPVVSISLSGSKIMNSNISISNPIPGMPEYLSVNITNRSGSQIEWALYDANGQSINFGNYFTMSDTGIMRLLGGSLASGKYSLAAYVDGYYSDKVDFEVYFYLEYFLGYYGEKYPEITEMPEGMFSASYQIHSMFHPQSYSRLEGQGRAEDFEFRDLLGPTPPDSHYAIINYDNNRWWWICGEENAITPVATSLTYSGYYDQYTQNPADVWRENISHDTQLKNPVDNSIVDGKTGTIVILGDQEYYFIRQSEEFHIFN